MLFFIRILYFFFNPVSITIHVIICDFIKAIFSNICKVVSHFRFSGLELIFQIVQVEFRRFMMGRDAWSKTVKLNFHKYYYFFLLSLFGIVLCINEHFRNIYKIDSLMKHTFLQHVLWLLGISN